MPNSKDELINLLKSDVRCYNPSLIISFGIKEGLILGYLIQNRSNVTYCGDGFFPCAENDLILEFGLKETEQIAILDSLCSQGLINVEYSGIPLTRYVKLNDKEILSQLSKLGKSCVDSISQFKKFSQNKPKAKGKNKFKTLYDIMVDKFSNHDLRNILCDYLKQKIGKISQTKWEQYMNELEGISSSYPYDVRDKATIETVKRSMEKGWLGFYRISDYDLKQLSNNINKFSEMSQPNNSLSAEDYALVLDESGNIKTF